MNLYNYFVARETASTETELSPCEMFVARAILLACVDYVGAIKRLETNPESRGSLKMKRECERFFGKRLEELTQYCTFDIDGKKLKQRLIAEKDRLYYHYGLDKRNGQSLDKMLIPPAAEVMENNSRRCKSYYIRSKQKHEYYLKNAERLKARAREYERKKREARRIERGIQQTETAKTETPGTV